MEGLWLVGGCALALFVSSFLYSAGGYSNKWLRRFISPALLCIALNGSGMILNNWHWQYLLTYPLIVLAFCLPYGSEIQWQKILMRLGVSVICLIASAVCLLGQALSLPSIGILIIQILLCLITVYFGVKNPFSNARLEEFLVSLFLTLFIPFWSFIR